MNIIFSQLAIRLAAMVAAFSAALFLSAGTLAWPAAWLYLALFFGFTVTLSLWLLRFNPDLLSERMTGIGKASQKAWDKIYLAIIGLVFFAWLTVMGLDAAHYRWSRIPVCLQSFGAFLLLCSFYLFFATFRENAFLSPAVRIQKDRTQRVVSTGPYSYVRHPMYAGFIPFALGTALLLGSWYGVLGALLLIGMVARRAVLEERMLREELEGYDFYMTQVRYRLVPYLW